MVSLAQTSRKYRGRKAATYEAVRRKQIRWGEENRIVERMLRDTCAPGSSIIDVPVGTGRFLKFYDEMEYLVTGVDISEEMLVLARKKKSRATFVRAGATQLDWDARWFEAAVCVRFLDLIDDKAMREVVKELCRVARIVICTIRFGRKYVPKSNTAEHDERQFRAHVARQGFAIVESAPIFNAGWHVVRMERKS